MTRRNDEINNILEYLSVNDQGFDCAKTDKMDSFPPDSMLVSTLLFRNQIG